MALSTLAQLMRQNAFQDFNTGEPGPRSSPASPALPGYARGSLGTSGSRPFQSRNVDAGEQRERGTLGGSIGDAFRQTMQPVSNNYGGRFGSYQSPQQFNRPRFGAPQAGGAPGPVSGAIGNAFGQLAGRARPQEAGFDRRQQLLQLLQQRFGGFGGGAGGGGVAAGVGGAASGVIGGLFGGAAGGQAAPQQDRGRQALQGLFGGLGFGGQAEPQLDRGRQAIQERFGRLGFGRR